MEKTLLLMRHAKSSWSNSSLEDFDRPLNERGGQAMGIMGPEVAVRMTPPSRILCSSAQRTRETLAFILLHTQEDMDISVRKNLYLASREELLSAAKDTPEEISTLLLIGHNPGIQDLARHLAGKSGGEDAARMKTKFPTAAVALFFLPPDMPWRDLGRRGLDVAAFLTPRDLVTSGP